MLNRQKYLLTVGITLIIFSMGWVMPPAGPSIAVYTASAGAACLSLFGTWLFFDPIERKKS